MKGSHPLFEKESMLLEASRGEKEFFNALVRRLTFVCVVGGVPSQHQNSVHVRPTCRARCIDLSSSDRPGGLTPVARPVHGAGAQMREKRPVLEGPGPTAGTRHSSQV